MITFDISCKKDKSDSQPAYISVEYAGSTSISEARSYLATASTGSKILFAGGINGTVAGVSDKVDIYDVGTGQLSESRIMLAVASAGNKIFFGGGFKSNSDPFSNKVDVFELK
jgi:uncharacterized protein YkvS